MVNRIEDWPWSSYLATDWLLSQFGKQRKVAMERYRQFVMDGVQHQPHIWTHLKGQIYLGDAAFVSNVQKRIGKEKDDLNIPRQQKRPIAKPLAQIAGQAADRNAAIIAAYATGAYSQREIGEHFQLHPSTVGYCSWQQRFLIRDLSLWCVSLWCAKTIVLRTTKREFQYGVTIACYPLSG